MNSDSKPPLMSTQLGLVRVAGYGIIAGSLCLKVWGFVHLHVRFTFYTTRMSSVLTCCCSNVQLDHARHSRRTTYNWIMPGTAGVPVFDSHVWLFDINLAAFCKLRGTPASA